MKKELYFIIFVFISVMLVIVAGFKANAKVSWSWEGHNTSYNSEKLCKEEKPLFELSPCVDILPDGIKCDFDECSLVDGKMTKDFVKIQEKMNRLESERQAKEAKDKDLFDKCTSKLDEELCRKIMEL